ncbi:hypothetical protein [Listeria monocytogenes]|nr:hypothetical protein [Listeria monocytogenes]
MAEFKGIQKKVPSKTIIKNVTITEWIADIAEVQQINFSQTLTDGY